MKFLVTLIGMFIALIGANAYINEVVQQYNELSGPTQLYTRVWCNHGDLTVQDRVDCYIINHN